MINFKIFLAEQSDWRYIKNAEFREYFNTLEKKYQIKNYIEKIASDHCSFYISNKNTLKKVIDFLKGKELHVQEDKSLNKTTFVNKKGKSYQVSFYFIPQETLTEAKWSPHDEWKDIKDIDFRSWFLAFDKKLHLNFKVRNSRRDSVVVIVKRNQSFKLMKEILGKKDLLTKEEPQQNKMMYMHKGGKGFTLTLHYTTNEHFYNNP